MANWGCFITLKLWRGAVTRARAIDAYWRPPRCNSVVGGTSDQAHVAGFPRTIVTKSEEQPLLQIAIGSLRTISIFCLMADEFLVHLYLYVCPSLTINLTTTVLMFHFAPSWFHFQFPIWTMSYMFYHPILNLTEKGDSCVNSRVHLWSSKCWLGQLSIWEKVLGSLSWAVEHVWIRW